MNEFFGSVIWLIIALGILISFHEFGHFWVARRLGVKVLRFSIGFGRPLWRRIGKDGTEYVVAMLPLGGYVRMLDEREDEVPASQLHLAFNRKPVLSRIAIVIAGPLFNLILAVAAFWLMFVVGIADMRPVLGHTQGMAAEAGLQRGATLTEVDGRAVETWSDAFQALIIPAVERRDITLEVDDPVRGVSRRQLPLSQLDDEFHESALLEYTGLSLWRPDIPTVLGEMKPDMPASAAGLQMGDRIARINDTAIDTWHDLVEVIDEQAQANRPLRIEWTRAGETFSSDIVPISDNSDGKERLIIGIQPAPLDEAAIEQWRSYQTIQRYGPVDALGVAVRHTVRLTTDTLSMLKQLVLGRASLDNLSGPITIAKLANDSASLGVARFLSFLGLISLSLGILNLLPIPMLDGGHLMYYLIELVKGGPVSEKVQIAGQYVGLVMLASLMGLAFFNDILRLLA
ncbi:MAG: RIP metalloprotease RseP [Wenzhouxiangellaceae bacterium]